MKNSVQNLSKIIWITGASTGIGHALTIKYLQEGWTVCASSRSISWANFNLSEDLCKKLHLYPVNVTEKEAIQKTIDSIFERFGKIDIAILNAGYNEFVTIDTFNSIVFESLIQINFLSVVYCLEALFPRMKHTQSTIAITSSVVSYIGLPRASAYGASKAALQNMIQALQVELYSNPLHLCLISPGFVKTPLTDKNEFPMPFLISSQKAAEYIFKGIAAKKLEIHFPFQMSFILKFLTYLPLKYAVFILSKSIKLKK